MFDLTSALLRLRDRYDFEAGMTFRVFPPLTSTARVKADAPTMHMRYQRAILLGDALTRMGHRATSSRTVMLEHDRQLLARAMERCGVPMPGPVVVAVETPLGRFWLAESAQVWPDGYDGEPIVTAETLAQWWREVGGVDPARMGA